VSTSTIIFLNKQIESANADINAIEVQIASDPPETTDQLLMLREAQNRYRRVIESLKAAIDSCE
jgi:hypothetical protein